MGHAQEAGSHNTQPLDAKLNRAAQRQLIRDAGQRASSGDVDSAIELYERCIDAGSYSIVPFKALSMLYREQADVEAEAQILSAALKWAELGDRPVDASVLDELADRFEELEGSSVTYKVAGGVKVERAEVSAVASSTASTRPSLDEPADDVAAAPPQIKEAAPPPTSRSFTVSRRVVGIVIAVIIGVALIVGAVLAQGKLSTPSAQEVKFDKDYLAVVEAVNAASSPDDSDTLSQGIGAAKKDIAAVAKGLGGYNKGNYRDAMTEMTDAATAYLDELQQIVDTDLKSGETIEADAAQSELQKFASAAEDAYLYLSDGSVREEVSADPDALATSIVNEFEAWQAEVERRAQERADAIAENNARARSAKELDAFDKKFRDWLGRYQDERDATGVWTETLDPEVPDTLDSQDRIDARNDLYEELMAMAWPEELAPKVEPFGTILIDAASAMESAQTGLSEYYEDLSYECSADYLNCDWQSSVGTFRETDGWKTFSDESERLAKELDRAITQYDSKVETLRKKYAKRVDVPPALT